MKQLRSRRKMLVISLVVLLAALMAGPVLAGGWAVITLDSLPGEVHAGESVHLSFMVRQHGKTPVHNLGDPSMPIEPTLTARNLETGETFSVVAVPEKEVGRFSMEVVFPGEGNWDWSIVPNPLAGTTEFATLTVLPALATSATTAETSAETTAGFTAEAAPSAAAINLTSLLRGAAVLLLAAGVLTVLLAGRRKQTQTAVVEVGD